MANSEIPDQVTPMMSAYRMNVPVSDIIGRRAQAGVALEAAAYSSKETVLDRCLTRLTNAPSTEGLCTNTARDSSRPVSWSNGKGVGG